MRLSSSRLSSFLTPTENEPSGIFSTIGKDSSSVARFRLRASSTRVFGAGIFLAARVSARNTLLVQRRIEVGSRSEEHTSELQSLMRISYAVFCLKKKIKNQVN